MKQTKPCMLMILDGWGINARTEGNAVYQAQTPFLDQLFREYPHTRLNCFGEAVGLPEGIMGNSEVGHLNIGAGRVVYQDLLRIDKSIADGSFFDNQALADVMDQVREKQSALHLMGLLSDGGVHSQLTHLFALLDMAKRKGVKAVKVHAILDGRDTAPDSGVGFVAQLQAYLDKIEFGTIATICGRYYAMDRDTRWDRTEQAYRLYTRGEGVSEKNPVEAVKNAYQRGETDEFVKPVLLVDDSSQPLGRIADMDGLIFFNFRADRARQITRALNDATFDFFAREPLPKLCGYVCMTLYDEHFDLPMAFPPVHLKDILGEVISRNGLHQLRIAETEKYAHVTYFFNGGEETPFENEDRCLIPSPRDIPTYDHKPQMSALEVTDEVIQRIKSNTYDFFVINFANMDMVGHTGILEAAIKAVETVDQCVKRIVPEILEQEGAVLITADHGNSETLIDENGHVHTAHTLNPVPFIVVDQSRKNCKLRDQGALCDIAPTVLDILGLVQPEKMTGRSMIVC